MAFKLHSTDGSARPMSAVYKPAGAITPKHGMALVESNGLLAIATGTTKPTYISLTEKDAAVTSGTVIAVHRINPDEVYETTFSASASSVKDGAKVTLHASSGLQVTGTTTNGVAEVVAGGGGASGAVALVRFP